MSNASTCDWNSNMNKDDKDLHVHGKWQLSSLFLIGIAVTYE